MIVHAKINYIKALQVTGKKFLLFLVATFLVNQCVTYFHWQDNLIPDKFVVLMSSAIGIFLGFRINAAYSRWKDGYGLFRDSIATCLSLLSQINLLTKSNPEQAEVFYQFKERVATILMQYNHTVRLELTHTPSYDWKEGLKALSFNQKPLFNDATIEKMLHKKRKGSYALYQLSKFIHQFNSSETITFIATGELAKSIQQLYILEQMMVSLKNTPFPWGYQFYTWLFVWILPVLFIFSTFNQLNIVDNVVMSFIATVFVTTEQVATNLDNPITSPFNSAPFQALCRILEIELLEELDIKHDLDFVEPKDGILH